MNCTEFQAEFLRGGISRAADAHLAGCAACRSELGELRSMVDTLADPATWEAPDPATEDRVVQAVGALADQSHGPSRRRWPLLAGAAAAVTVAVAAVVVTASEPADWTLNLIPEPEHAGASAVVAGWNVDGGTRMEVEVQGIPAVGSDEYYELWLTAEDGRHVSAGTFSGSGTFPTMVAVRRADFPRVWVTLEPNDDDEALSGITVFDSP